MKIKIFYLSNEEYFIYILIIKDFDSKTGTEIIQDDLDIINFSVSVWIRISLQTSLL